MNDTQTFTFGPKHPRGTCKHCGAPAYTGQATSCLPGGKCQTKGDDAGPGPETKVTIDRPAAERMTAPKADTAASAPKGKPDPAARALVLERSILDDLNPMLLQGFAMACKPVASEAFFVLDGDKMVPTEIGNAIMFSETEAKYLGKAAAELEKSQIGMMASAVAGPLMPVLYGVAGVGILAFHGYRLVQLRNGLLMQVAQAQQEQQRQTAGEDAVRLVPDPDEVFAQEGQPSANRTTAQPMFTERDIA
jgi:hypothetical protein